MRSSQGTVAALAAGIAQLDAEDIPALPDAVLRQQLLDLLAAVNQLHAQVARRVAAFDARGLAVEDGCRSAKSWLRAFGRISGTAAGAWVKAARLLRQLPALAAAAAAGKISAEHVARVAQLTDRVGLAPVQHVEQILTEAASTVDPSDLQKVCDHVRAHVDPDGSEPDPYQDYQRRGITASPFDGMLIVRGQLDPEGGAALMAALDAFMTPPTGDDERTPAQRRADALVELARSTLTAGRAPTVGGVRPQIGILLTPRTLTHARPASRRHDEHRRAIRLAGTGDDRTDGDDRPDSPDSPDLAGGEADGQRPSRADPLTAGVGPPLPEPARLDWIGEIPDSLAQRIACDSDIWRIVLDPATGLPLDVGRTHRLVPHWIRKALWVRDRGCRFPGCHAPAQWTDAHHVTLPWALGGQTTVDNLVLLCRHHHVLVHEGGWTIHFNSRTGTVTAVRPDGRPYEIAPSHPWTRPSTRAA